MSETQTASQRIRSEYQYENGVITSPGKFEGEPIFAPYFWDLALEGMADRDDGKSFKFKLHIDAARGGTDAALLTDWPELKPWLGQRRILTLTEDSQGFVHCS